MLVRACEIAQARHAAVCAAVRAHKIGDRIHCPQNDEPATGSGRLKDDGRQNPGLHLCDDDFLQCHDEVIRRTSPAFSTRDMFDFVRGQFVCLVR